MIEDPEEVGALLFFVESRTGIEIERFQNPPRCSSEISEKVPLASSHFRVRGERNSSPASGGEAENTGDCLADCYFSTFRRMSL